MAAARFDELFAGALRFADAEDVAGLEALCAAHPEHADALWAALADRLELEPQSISTRAVDGEEIDQSAAGLPARVGPYTVLEELGSGGMGVVYLAEQSSPVRRQVAVKVIRRGMICDSVLARFEAERQALAIMDHSAIARIFDCGLTAGGEPYFAMEYVKGVPITRYCDEGCLGLKGRIELFIEVCAGVQHAHLKGVIHRDLTPSNILVTEQDGRPLPKVIDFGLARATEATSDDTPAFTQLGQVVGTPEYMSPEQSGLDNLDIDSRTDVYTLGVVLYELLVGARPFRLRRTDLAEMQRVIREQEPRRPSTRVSDDHGDARAQRRRLDAKGLARLLRGDLDWIVMCALDKDRSRRYATPSELAGDLRRYLDDEPVRAGPPGISYRLKKLARRYRLQFAAGIAVLATLIAGIVGTSYFMVDAWAQEARYAAENQRFNSLAVAVKLEDARRSERLLVPEWPAQIPAMKAWQARYGEQLAAALPAVRRALRELEARAEPATEAQRAADRATHEDFARWQQLRQMVPALERALATRDGDEPPVAELPDDAPTTAPDLNARAWKRVAWHPLERTVWGEEALGLAYARRAVATATADRHVYRDTLAWALFANGFDQAARDASRQALAEAPAQQQAEFRDNLAKLEREIGASRKLLADRSSEFAALDDRVRDFRVWRFSSETDRFLHQQLLRAEGDLETFLGPAGVRHQVRCRRRWAEQIDGATLDHPGGARWSEARAAIRAADGERASELYAAHPIDLVPQTGLVPIGMNPRTGLWEFYHLRSAWDPRSGGDPCALPIPRHDADGNLEIGDGTGIVFVLVPGGTFLKGSQSRDAKAPNYDQQAQENEIHRRSTVPPFFLARFEMTKGQWGRLAWDDAPSLYPAGIECRGNPDPITAAHPVTNVDWHRCREVVRAHGLDLPSEVRWEYACRAGSTTPWFPGERVSDLQGVANLADRRAHQVDPSWRHEPSLEDGWVTHAPVGSFAANRFGLHDTHGNVWEWCGNDYAEWRGKLSADSAILKSRTVRGGSYYSMAVHARSAMRGSRPADSGDQYTGLRPSRTVHK